MAAARQRSDRVDHLLAELSARLEAVPGSVAILALDAYGRRELTPRGDVDVLFLHQGHLSSRLATEAVCYPLWELNIRVEPSVRTLDECLAEGYEKGRFTRQSPPTSSRLPERHGHGQASTLDAEGLRPQTPSRDHGGGSSGLPPSVPQVTRQVSCRDHHGGPCQTQAVDRHLCLGRIGR